MLLEPRILNDLGYFLSGLWKSFEEVKTSNWKNDQLTSNGFWKPQDFLSKTNAGPKNSRNLPELNFFKSADFYYRAVSL